MKPFVFQCCAPCRDGRCGAENCNHAELDQAEFHDAADTCKSMHDGCFCVVEARIPIEIAVRGVEIRYPRKIEWKGEP